jgi:hypothetical protein
MEALLKVSAIGKVSVGIQTSSNDSKSENMALDESRRPNGIGRPARDAVTYITKRRLSP